MTEIDYHIIATPLHPLKIRYSAKILFSLNFTNERPMPKKTVSHNVLDATIDCINRYFQGKPISIKELPLVPAATPFAECLRVALLNTKMGQTYTYAEIAAHINSHPRAIGQGCKRNPYPLLIPCHRIVAQHQLGGYMGHSSGDFFDIKQKLLHFEKMTTINA